MEIVDNCERDDLKQAMFKVLKLRPRCATWQCQENQTNGPFKHPLPIASTWSPTLADSAPIWPQKPMVEAKCSAASRLLVRPVAKTASRFLFELLRPSELARNLPLARRKTAETSMPREKKKHMTISGRTNAAWSVRTQHASAATALCC